ncbi:MAG: AMP-binding protein, partial [Acidobacteria bacterium]|nr:AMP-binding protein [Acidobacteriota bacterium]
PPSFLQLWARETSGSESPALPVRLVMTGGEALAPEVVRLWPSTPLGRARLLNGYGPTEAVITVSLHEVPAGASLSAVPIGRPLAGRWAHVLDRHGNPVPAGVPGELVLGGLLARGYLGRPDITAERFVPDRFSGEPGARLYRTGDRVRWLPTGDLDFLGRLDQQVKVRGFRIEPGEIEAALARHPAVAQAAVVVTGDGLSRRLVAFLVAAGEAPIPDAGELRVFLGRTLPDYMVPSVFVEIGALPLTPGGKVDRRTLAGVAPAGGTCQGSAAPSTQLEQVLAGIWAEVLRLGEVAADADFFALGGHSLLATQVVSRVREVLGVELPLRSLFEKPTVAALAAEVEALRARELGFEAPPLLPTSWEGDLPLSFAQERLWFLDQLEPGSSAYNMPIPLHLSGALDATALGRVLSEVVRRHAVLRTRFVQSGGSPAQVIDAAGDVALPVVDLQSLPSELGQAEAVRLAAEEKGRAFDLARGPLLRSLLMRLGVEEHVIILNQHHIVSDGWSLDVLVREVAALYPAFAAGRPSPLPELAIQYADFALWQRGWLQGEVLEKEISYWRQSLAGVAALELPTDRPRPAVQTSRGAIRSFFVPRELSESAAVLGRSQGATLFMVGLAVFAALLQRTADQDDLAIGTPIAGRNRAELEGLVGFFVNTLALRVDGSGEPDFRALLSRVRETALGAFAHQDLPFEKVVEELQPQRDLSRSPLFQAMFALDHASKEAPLELPGLSLRPFPSGTTTAKFELTLSLSNTGSGLAGGIEFNLDLFDAATIDRLARRFEILLAGVVAEPGRPLSELPLLDEAEAAQIAVWSRSAEVAFVPGCLHELFETQADLDPDVPAVVAGGESLSYGELEARANRLARHLRRVGVGPEVAVGLTLLRSAEGLVALLAILKAGGVYVPLDAAHPRERRAWMLADAGARVLLTREALKSELAVGPE